MSALSQLSFPKGKALACELCGKPATRQCDSCRCTFYCTKEHQSVDAQGIHDKICKMLAALRAPADEIGSEEDRERRDKALKANQRRLIDLTREQASTFLVNGQFELAVPGALQSLRFSLAVYGEGHVELVPAYLLLAEANLGLGRAAQVEEFLSMANWSVLKNPSCSNGLRSKLHRNFGKMHLAQGKYAEALRSLAQDAYFSSLESGPDSTLTAGAYYHLGATFLAMDNQESALAMHDKVVDSWYKYLVHVRSTGSQEVEEMSEALAAESTAILTSIAGVRERVLGSSHIANGEVHYTLGLLKSLRGDTTGANAAFMVAKQVYEATLGGEIVEQGTYEELMEKENSAFADLVKRQLHS